MAPGCAASASAPSAWRCITSSATRSAARFDLPHAETHTIVLPHALAYNAPAVPDAMARDSARDRRRRCGAGLFDLAEASSARQLALRDIGMPESGIDKAADLAVDQRLLEPAPARARRHPRPDRPRLGRRAARSPSKRRLDAMRRTLIKSAVIISMDDAIGDLPAGDVLVEGSRIVDVRPSIDLGSAQPRPRSSTAPGGSSSPA